jgi:hypothetical protein
MEKSLNIRALWTGKSPLRVAGNIVMLWFGAVFVIILTSFYVPSSKSQWLWLIGAGPPSLFVSWAIAEWVKNKDPELPIWEILLTVAGLIVLIAWGIHSIP